jgi:hypothetical protein
MLEVVFLFVDLGKVEDDDASREVDELLIGCFVLSGVHLDIGQGPAHIATSETVDPVHLGIDVFLVVGVEL